MKIYDNVYFAQRLPGSVVEKVLSAESLRCIVALREREIEAVERLGRLNLIPHSLQLTVQVAYLKMSSKMLRSLLKLRLV